MHGVHPPCIPPRSGGRRRRGFYRRIRGTAPPPPGTRRGPHFPRRVKDKQVHGRIEQVLHPLLRQPKDRGPRQGAVPPCGPSRRGGPAHLPLHGNPHHRLPLPASVDLVQDGRRGHPHLAVNTVPNVVIEQPGMNVPGMVIREGVPFRHGVEEHGLAPPHPRRCSTSRSLEGMRRRPSRATIHPSSDQPSQNGVTKPLGSTMGRQSRSGTPMAVQLRCVLSSISRRTMRTSARHPGCGRGSTRKGGSASLRW